jgi:hypothetical protein
VILALCWMAILTTWTVLDVDDLERVEDEDDEA